MSDNTNIEQYHMYMYVHVQPTCRGTKNRHRCRNVHMYMCTLHVIFRLLTRCTPFSRSIKMALVQGEDSESDEEINTDQLTEGALGYTKGTAYSMINPQASIVPGEESETDEEDDGAAPLSQPDSLRPPPVSSRSSSRDSSRRTSLDSTSTPPPS